MDGIQDFFDDHPNWGKVIVAVVAAAMAFCGSFFPLENQIDAVQAEAQAEHIARVEAEAALADQIAVNADLITELETAQIATDAKLQTHMTAYSVFVEFINAKVEANEIAIGDIWDWIDSFSVTWADFVRTTELRFEGLYSAMSSWYNYLVANCCSELEE